MLGDSADARHSQGSMERHALSLFTQYKTQNGTGLFAKNRLSELFGADSLKLMREIRFF